MSLPTVINNSPTFAVPTGTGKLIFPLGDASSEARSVLLQSDGKIVVVGTAFNDSARTMEFFVIRLNSNGSLDTDFGGSGKLMISVGSGGNYEPSAALLPDGKIVVAGYSSNGGINDFGVIRLNTDGSLDKDFGGTGKLIVPVGSSFRDGIGVTVQPDSKIIVTGGVWRNNGNDIDFTLVRLNTNGSLDTDFGEAGKLNVPVGVSVDSSNSVSLQSDGKIVVA